MKAYTLRSSSYLVSPSGLAASRQKQAGISLLFALIALALMTVAGFSLMRSVDTGNVIAGNMAFRQTTTNGGDLAIEAAAAYINTTIFPSPDANRPTGCNAATTTVLGTCLYSTRIQAEDEDGVPRIDWSNTANIPSISSNGISYQYVVERMCIPDTSVAVNLGQSATVDGASSICATELVDPGRGNVSTGYSGATQPSRRVGIRYRVTARVTGPRNTVSTIQAILER